MPRLVKYAAVLKLTGERWEGFLAEFPHLQERGKTQEEVLLRLAERLQVEVDMLKSLGSLLPPPITRVAYVSTAERGAYEILPC